MDTTKGSHTQADAAAEPGSAPLQGIEYVATSRLPTRHGEFVLHSYRQLADGTEHAVLVCGEVAGQEDVHHELAVAGGQARRGHVLDARQRGGALVGGRAGLCLRTPDRVHSEA